MLIGLTLNLWPWFLSGSLILSSISLFNVSPFTCFICYSLQISSSHSPILTSSWWPWSFLHKNKAADKYTFLSLSLCTCQYHTLCLPSFTAGDTVLLSKASLATHVLVAITLFLLKAFAHNDASQFFPAGGAMTAAGSLRSHGDTAEYAHCLLFPNLLFLEPISLRYLSMPTTETHLWRSPVFLALSELVINNECSPLLIFKMFLI